MILFVISIILAVVAVVALFVTFMSKDFRFAGGVVAAIGVVGAAVAMFFATFYANGVGEAKVQINALDKSVVGTITEPGHGFQAPWTDFVTFDLFSQEAVYAGKGSDTPSYSGGSVDGAEVTVAVGGESGGSTQANIDISVTYSLDAEKVQEIYETYRSQERFTKQVVEKTILSTIRSVPAQYSATEFRGDKRNEASDKIATALNDKLGELGVHVDFVNIQDVRYPEEVEAALKDVEVSNQKQQKAEAELRAAETAAKQKVVEAKAEADANHELAKSLSDEILEQRRIDALKTAAENGNLIIDGGDGGVLIQR